MKNNGGNRRSRNRGSGKRQGGGGGRNNFESNGPEVKVRGTAQQVLEKYLVLARDSASAGDRIKSESCFQFAEHYYRIANADGSAHSPIVKSMTRKALRTMMVCYYPPPPLPHQLTLEQNIRKKRNGEETTKPVARLSSGSILST